MNLKRQNKTAAQELVLNNGNRVLISYSTPVACYILGQGYFKTDKKWSVTTSKHINKWVSGVAEVKP